MRRPGDAEFCPLSIDLLYVDDGQISAIHCFIAPAHVHVFIDTGGSGRPRG